MRGDGDVLYGLTSFRMYRIPHQVFPLCPPIPSLWQHVRDPELLDYPVIREILGTPLHLLITDRRDRRTSKAIRTRTDETPASDQARKPNRASPLSPSMHVIDHMLR